jgi:hypothetical protein
MTATNSLFNEALFVVPFKTGHGDTIEVTDPKREAMKACLMTRLMSKKSSVIKNDDGSWTVKGEGCTDVTYVSKKWKEPKE